MSFQVISTGGEYSDGGGCSQECEGHHLAKPGIHLFTAKWCGHCTNLKTALKEATCIISGGANGPKTGAFEAASHMWGMWEHDSEVKIKPDDLITHKFGIIRGYPTIYFKTPDGETEEYNGSREPKKMVEAFEKFVSKP